MTLTDIANIALESVGGDAINNIDEDTSTARKVKRALKMAISDVAAMRNWVCLQKEMTLTRSIGTSFNGEYKFNAPKNLINIIESSAEFRKEGDFILSRAPELAIRCTILSDNPMTWCANLQGAVIAKLKSMIVASIVGNFELSAQTIQLAERDIARYLTNDISNETPRHIQKRSTWYSGY